MIFIIYKTNYLHFINNYFFTKKTIMSTTTIIDSCPTNEGQKLTRFRWDKVERTLPPRDRNVLDTLFNYGSSYGIIKNKSNDSTLKTISNDVYEAIRPIIFKYLKLEEIIINDTKLSKKDQKKSNKNKNKKDQKMKTKDRIILKNTISLFTIKFNEIYENKKNIPTQGTYQYIELQLIQFMFFAKLGLKQLKDKKNEQLLYESYMAFKKILYIASSDSFNTSSNLLIDANQFLNSFDSKFKINTLVTKYERLITETLYDEIYTNQIIKLYDEQVKLLDHIYEGEINGIPTLLLYNTLPGSGKTTIVTALAGQLKAFDNFYSEQEENDSDTINDSTIHHKQILFSCSSEVIRDQVGSIAYNQGIKFAMVTTCRQIDNYNCNGYEPDLLICDLVSTIDLLYQVRLTKQQELEQKLKEQEEHGFDLDDQIDQIDPTDQIDDYYINPRSKSDFILFLDEPTIYADKEFEEGIINPITSSMVKIMMNTAPLSIWCSATLPNENQIPTLINNFSELYQETSNTINIVKLTSNKINIGCQLIKPDGSFIAPHNNIASSEISKLVQILEENVFLRRLYTPQVMSSINDMFETGSLDSSLEISNYFKEHKITNNNICEYSIKLLEQVQEQQTQVQETISSKAINFDLLFTEQAHRFMGGTLYVSNDPMEDVLRFSNELLEGIDSISNLNRDYQTNLAAYNRKIANLERNVKDEDERSQQIQELNKPKLTIPDEYRINTNAHVNRFTKHLKLDKIELFDNRMLQRTYPLSDLSDDLIKYIPEVYIKLLYVGIGIYMPDSEILNPLNSKFIYTNTVMDLCEKGHLSFLFSNDSISYGANYPFTNVIITDEFASVHSQNTLYQLMGRCGRVGKSYMAKVFTTSDETCNKIMNITNESIEGDNMEYYANLFKNE
jgi:hypothetical protein